jgi:hypothetical protein
MGFNGFSWDVVWWALGFGLSGLEWVDQWMSVMASDIVEKLTKRGMYERHVHM